MKKPLESKRSGKWPTLRKQFLLGKVCAVCGGSKKLEAHHMKPFHLHPKDELSWDNLIALCEGDSDGLNCHLLVGHLGSFKSYNQDVVKDAKSWSKKIKGRP